MEFRDRIVICGAEVVLGDVKRKRATMAISNRIKYAKEAIDDNLLANGNCGPRMRRLVRESVAQKL